MPTSSSAANSTCVDHLQPTSSDCLLRGSVERCYLYCCLLQTSVVHEDYTAVDFADGTSLFLTLMSNRFMCALGLVLFASDVRGKGMVMVAGTSTGHVSVFST